MHINSVNNRFLIAYRSSSWTDCAASDRGDPGGKYPITNYCSNLIKGVPKVNMITLFWRNKPHFVEDDDL